MASSSRRDRLDLTLGRSGLARYFQATVAGDEVAHGKPAPDVYLAAAERLGVRPADCLAVEDTGHGAASAVAAGMRVIGVARIPAEVGRLLAAGAAPGEPPRPGGAARVAVNSPLPRGRRGRCPKGGRGRRESQAAGLLRLPSGPSAAVGAAEALPPGPLPPPREPGKSP